MPTLLDLKKQAGLTHKQVGLALGCSAGVASDLLHGRHILVISDERIQQIAMVLGITFERCWYGMCESYNQTYGTPDKQHQRASEVQAQAEITLKVRMPDLSIEVSSPRPLVTVEAIVLIGGENEQS